MTDCIFFTIVILTLMVILIWRKLQPDKFDHYDDDDDPALWFMGDDPDDWFD